MADQPPDQQHARPGLAGALALLLGYLDRPWKAVVVILLMIVGGTAYIVYEKRDALIEAFLTPTETELLLADIPAALDKLVEESDADLVQIWSVDLASNSQYFIAARRKGGERPVIPNPRRLPIIVTVSDIKMLIDVLQGQPVCVDIVHTGSPLARRLAERGMRRGCAIPIPPNPDQFVGVIYLAWQDPPDPNVEGVVVGAAREIAKKLVTH